MTMTIIAWAMIIVFLALVMMKKMQPFTALLLVPLVFTLGGAFLAPFLYGLFWRGTTVAGMWVSFAIGVGLSGGNAIFGWMSPINAGAVSMSRFFAGLAE